MIISCNNCGARIPKQSYTYHLKVCMATTSGLSKRPKYDIAVSQLSTFPFLSSSTSHPSMITPENITFNLRNLSGDRTNLL
jgi:hypothetical protein